MKNDVQVAGVIDALTVALAHLYARHFAATGESSAEAARVMEHLANVYENERRPNMPEGDALFEAVQWGRAHLDHLAELVVGSLPR